ncbi:MAG: hypothetical protein K6F55_04190 [Eubacterium sp.]|nr:hypothetical protein [Eubacterium sp.]
METTENKSAEKMETTEKKDNKIIIFVILGLLVITAVAAVIYLSQRAKTPEHSLVVVSGGKEKIIDIDKLDTFSFSGTVANGKGEKKEVEGEGLMIADIIKTSDYSMITVTSDDAYSAEINKDEMDKAWLQIEDGTARLIVFGDKDSKRNVKNVVRIELK